MNDLAHTACIRPDCGRTYDARDAVFACGSCGGLLDVRYDWSRAPVPKRLAEFERRWRRSVHSHADALDFSGVWRFRELLPFAPDDAVVTIGEGQTVLQRADGLAAHLGMSPGRLDLQYEGMNPTGSFKDNGMTAAITVARMLGKTRVACASTGNTSASMAMYAAVASTPDRPMQAIVFIGAGKIAYGKLAQTLDYGARTLQIDGDFDACMRRVREVADSLGIYLMNSVNPFRLEGQKSVMFRVLEQRGWEPPDWIVVPGGNLGNTSAFGKAFIELRELGLINRLPRLAVINAAGANTLYELHERRGIRWNGGKVDLDAIAAAYAEFDRAGARARTIASAIEIGRPVNLTKALRSLDAMSGLVREVSDEEILEHKAMVGRFGFGCEPASAASVAGLHRLLEEQIIGRDERVVCILTGHALKDPDAVVNYHAGIDMKSRTPPAPQPTTGRLANRPRPVPDDLTAIIAAIENA